MAHLSLISRCFPGSSSAPCSSVARLWGIVRIVADLRHGDSVTHRFGLLHCLSAGSVGTSSAGLPGYSRSGIHQGVGLCLPILCPSTLVLLLQTLPSVKFSLSSLKLLAFDSVSLGTRRTLGTHPKSSNTVDRRPFCQGMS